MSGWLLAVVLLVVPLIAIGPALLPGARLLPQAPVASAPLATESPAAAAAALAGSNYSTADRLFPVLTDQLEARRQVLSGELPTWDPGLGAGVPLFGATIAALAYPPNWLALVLPPDLAAAPLAILSLFLAGLGMALFLRRRGLAEGAVLVGALALQSSTWVLANLHYFMKVDAALWLPWMLLGIEGLASEDRAERRRGGRTLALAVGLSLLAGFPPIALFAIATAGLYALVRCFAPGLLGSESIGAEDGRKTATVTPSPGLPALARAAAFVLVGLCIGAWQVLPTLEASGQSRRIPRTAETMVAEALPTSTTAGLLIPDLFGAPDVAMFDSINPLAAWLTSEADGEKLLAHNELEWNTHLGSLALLLALVALLCRPRQALLPAAILVLWLGFAQAWPGLRLLYHVPGLNLGAPSRALACAWPMMAWLAALGADALLAPDGRRGLGAAWLALVGGGLLAGFTFLLYGIEDAGEDSAMLFQTLIGRHGMPAEDLQAWIRDEHMVSEFLRLYAAYGGVLASALTLAAVGALGLVVVLLRGHLGGRHVIPMVAALGLSVALVPRAITSAIELPGIEALVLAASATVVLGLALARLDRIRRVAQQSVPTRRRGELIEARERLGALGSALSLLLVIGLAVETLDVAPRHLRPQRLTVDAPAGAAGPSLAPSLAPSSAALGAVQRSARRDELDGRTLRLDLSPSGVGETIQLARPNLLELFGVKDLTPYMVFTPRTLVELIEALDPSSTYRSGIAALTDPALLASPVLDMLRVNTILSTEALPAHPRLEPELALPGFHVTHRAGALPTAWLAEAALLAHDDGEALGLLTDPSFDPRAVLVLAPNSQVPTSARSVTRGQLAARATVGSSGEASPTELPQQTRDQVSWWRPAAFRFDASVTTEAGAWLVIGEQFYPDWKCNLDGVDAQLLRANHALRALWIPPGEHLVRTWYEPWSLRYGASLMALGLALLLGSGLAGRFGPRQPPSRRSDASAGDSSPAPLPHDPERARA
ncbi:MAG: hypothetical protein P1V81_11610 [Planctomycetota bacterium]|nr:hypothetical protein [Planctomycetota bacterium]